MEILAEGRLAETDWRTIEPNEYGDWIGQRSADFHILHPLTSSDAFEEIGEQAPIFVKRTLGLVTSRDAWCYNSSQRQLRENIRRSVDYYNSQVAAFQKTDSWGTATARTGKAKAFVPKAPHNFHWDAKNYRDLANGEIYQVDESGFRVGAYRPFFKQRLYFDSRLNNSIRDFREIYPSVDAGNLGIYITGPGSSVPLSTFITDSISDSGLTSGNGSSPYIPRWRYRPAQAFIGADAPQLERVSNINPQALAEFRARYGDRSITDDDLFYYVYAVLHSPQYREKFANDLSKSQARIPMAATAADFRSFADAGRELADLHVNYENAALYPLEEVHSLEWNPGAQDAFRVSKMRYPGRRSDIDKTRIIYNAGITLVGIPEKAHEYVLGTRSALDWLIERYRVSVHKESGITNDPNDWSVEVGDPRYILDLVKRVTMVSIRTVDIVAGLPELRLGGFGGA